MYTQFGVALTGCVCWKRADIRSNFQRFGSADERAGSDSTQAYFMVVKLVLQDWFEMLRMNIGPVARFEGGGKKKNRRWHMLLLLLREGSD